AARAAEQTRGEFTTRSLPWGCDQPAHSRWGGAPAAPGPAPSAEQHSPPGTTSPRWPATSSSAGWKTPNTTAPGNAAFAACRKNSNKVNAAPAAGRDAPTASAPVRNKHTTPNKNRAPQQVGPIRPPAPATDPLPAPTSRRHETPPPPRLPNLPWTVLRAAGRAAPQLLHQEHAVGSRRRHRQPCSLLALSSAWAPGEQRR